MFIRVIKNISDCYYLNIYKFNYNARYKIIDVALEEIFNDPNTKANDIKCLLVLLDKITRILNTNIIIFNRCITSSDLDLKSYYDDCLSNSDFTVIGANTETLNNFKYNNTGSIENVTCYYSLNLGDIIRRM